jgi:hypothetical protein
MFALIGAALFGMAVFLLVYVMCYNPHDYEWGGFVAVGMGIIFAQFGAILGLGFGLGVGLLMGYKFVWIRRACVALALVAALIAVGHDLRSKRSRIRRTWSAMTCRVANRAPPTL